MKHTTTYPAAATGSVAVISRDASLAFGPPLFVAAPQLAPLQRPRPWLHLLNDADQEDGFEYHNPNLGFDANQ